jgi:hypothetical protein
MLFFPSLALAQGGLLTGNITVISSSGRPVAGATVTVCNIADNGVPCTQTVSIFQDPALSIPAANPGVTDGNGNFVAFASAGNYHYTITGNGVSTVGQPYTTMAPVGSSACFPSLNGISYVGGACASAWGGGDIGAQINTAYAALPATGGSITVIPQAAGACYNYSTPIIFGTLGKLATLRGLTASNSAPTATGSCINYTPTSGTAITLDWSAVAPLAWQSNVAIADLTITNNPIGTPCGTAGGCGSGAIAIQTGPTNGGAAYARFSNVNVMGFGNGWRNSAGNGWGRIWDGGSFGFNTVGVQLNVGNENDTFIGTKFVDNGINIALALVPAEVSLISTSMDAATSCGVTMTNLTFLYASNVHWENNGIANTQFVCGPSGSTMTLTGGVISDDHNAGGPSPNASTWFQFGHGTVSNVDIRGFNSDYTGGKVFNPLEYASVSGIAVENPTTLTDGILCPVPVRCSLSYTSSSQPAGISWNNNTTTNILNQGCNPSGGCFAGVSACVSSAKTITLPHTYNSNPAVILSDETTAGGVRITGKNTSQFTVACSGATDAFDWIAIGNPN